MWSQVVNFKGLGLDDGGGGSKGGEEEDEGP